VNVVGVQGYPPMVPEMVLELIQRLPPPNAGDGPGSGGGAVSSNPNPQTSVHTTIKTLTPSHQTPNLQVLATAVAGEPFPVQPVCEVRDAFGNKVASEYAVAITARDQAGEGCVCAIAGPGQVKPSLLLLYYSKA